MIVLCDVDNCISEDLWRVPFIRWHLPDPNLRFRDYHLAAALDSAQNLDVLRQHWNARVFFLTAMPEEYGGIRENWLQQNRINYERVLYRPRGNHQCSIELKRGMVRQLRDEGVPLWECRAAYDDRAEIVAMFQQEGLPGVQLRIHDIDYREHNAMVHP